MSSQQSLKGHWKNATSESIALLVQGKEQFGYGSVVAWAGKTISDEIQQVGNGLEDLGFVKAPTGFVIWEGVFEWCGDREDGSVEPNGAFRPLTPDEWVRLAATGVPWEFEGDASAPRLPSRQFVPTDEQRHNDALLKKLHDMGATKEQAIGVLIEERNTLLKMLQEEREKPKPMRISVNATESQIAGVGSRLSLDEGHTRCGVCGIIYESSGMCPRAKLGEHEFYETPQHVVETASAVVGGIDIEPCIGKREP